MAVEYREPSIEDHHEWTREEDSPSHGPRKCWSIRGKCIAPGCSAKKFPWKSFCWSFLGPDAARQCYAHHLATHDQHLWDESNAMAAAFDKEKTKVVMMVQSFNEREASRVQTELYWQKREEDDRRKHEEGASANDEDEDDGEDDDNEAAELLAMVEEEGRRHDPYDAKDGYGGGGSGSGDHRGGSSGHGGGSSGLGGGSGHDGGSGHGGGRDGRQRSRSRRPHHRGSRNDRGGKSDGHRGGQSDGHGGGRDGGRDGGRRGGGRDGGREGGRSNVYRDHHNRVHSPMRSPVGAPKRRARAIAQEAHRWEEDPMDTGRAALQEALGSMASTFANVVAAADQIQEHMKSVREAVRLIDRRQRRR